MGQEEVYECLKKSKEPLLSREIAETLKVPSKKIFKHLKKMIRYGEVYYIEIDRKEAMARTAHLGSSKIKRATRLYYIKNK